MIGCPNYLCANGKCLPSELKCNGKDDCGDNSDELDGCLSKRIFLINVLTLKIDYRVSLHILLLSSDGVCRIGEFLCNNRNCISHDMTCNAENDCGDWSDETNCRGLHIFY